MEAVRRGLSREADFKSALKDVDPTFKVLYGVGLSSEKVRDALQPIPDVVEGLAETVLQGIEVLSALIELVQDFVEVIATFLGIVVDIFEALVLSIIEVLQTIRNFFVGTSISGIFHFPQEFKTQRNLDEILYDIGMAFLDVNDENRPIAEATSTAMTVISMFTLPSLPNIQQLFDRLLSLILGFPEDFNFNSSKATYDTDEFRQTGASIKPNFLFKVGLSDLPPIKKLIDKLDELIKMLSEGKGFAEAINSIINAVLARIQRIKDLITQILNTIANLLSFFSLGEGQNVVSCIGKGTNADFAKVIMSLPNDPKFPSVELGTAPDGVVATQLDKNVFKANTFSGATALHFQIGEGGSDQKLEAIRKLFMRDVFREGGKSLKKENDDLGDNPINQGNIKTGWTQVRRGRNNG